MFSLHDIDFQIQGLITAAVDLEERAERYEDNPMMSLLLKGNANGLREAAYCLRQMIESAIETEAREALR